MDGTSDGIINSCTATDFITVYGQEKGVPGSGNSYPCQGGLPWSVSTFPTVNNYRVTSIAIQVMSNGEYYLVTRIKGALLIEGQLYFTHT